MDNEELALLARVENTHWWYRTRQAELLAWARQLPVGARVLDVGSAAGGHVMALSQEGFQVDSLEYSDWAVAHQRSRGIRVTQGDARAIPWDDAAFDAVICLDVLEHIDEHEQVASELRRVLKPGGRFLVAAPEDASMWSAHDEAVGHVRRYSKAGIIQLLDSAGLRPESAWSSNVLLKPLVKLRRKTAVGSELAEPNFLENTICTIAFRVEKALGLRRFGGMTIWVSGRAEAR